MSVYYGNSVKNNEKVAVKIDKIEKKHSAVLNEIFILEKLKGIKQIPSLLDYECDGEKILIIENLFDPSLKSILNFTDKEFDIITISFLGLQMVNILKSS